MPSSTLKMDEVCIIKILLPTYQITLCRNLKDQNLVHSMVFPTKMQTREVTKSARAICGELLKVTIQHTLNFVSNSESYHQIRCHEIR